MTFIERAQGLIGPKHVLLGDDAAPYGHDWSGKYNSMPICVLRPANTQEVSALMALAFETDTSIVPVSGNTGLSGGTYAEHAAMLSLERLNTIRDIRPEGRVAVVDAGVILQTLRDAVSAHDLIFPVTFGAQGSARIGGVLSTNAGGSNVVRYGNTRNQVLGIEVVLADGRVMDLMTELYKDNSGYDLRDLMIGAEGTLGIITAAALKLAPAPATFAAAMVAPVSLEAALVVLNRLQAATGGAVEAFEYMPRGYVEAHVRDFAGREPFDAPHDVNVFVELGGDESLGSLLETELGAALEAGLIADAVLAQSEAQRSEMWARREAAAEIAFGRKPMVTNDIALPLDRVAEFLDQMATAVAQIDADADTTCVAHLGDGNIHYVVYPSRDDAGLSDAIMQMVEKAVSDLGGTFSAEHGIGLYKLPSMRRLKDPVAMDVMRSIKAALDPKGILNPGKVLPS